MPRNWQKGLSAVALLLYRMQGGLKFGVSSMKLSRCLWWVDLGEHPAVVYLGDMAELVPAL